MIILFRGQTRRFGEKVRATDGFPLPSNFVYGGLFPANDGQDFAIIYQQYPDIKKFAVYADTVGQYRNRDDIHGVKIFDGDILKVRSNTGKEYLRRVFFDAHSSSFVLMSRNSNIHHFTPGEIYEVVGNIYDDADMFMNSKG